MTTADRFARGLAMTGAAGVVLALLTGGGGCELVVTDTVPPYHCQPGTADNCPGGSVCVPATHLCVARASTCTPGVPATCTGGLQCNPQTLKCASPASIADAAAGADGSSGPDATTGGPSDTGTEGPDGDLAEGRASDAPVPDATNPADATADAPGTCRGIACVCSGSSFCDSGICADSLTATSALYAANNNSSFCTQPCCTSSDCPGSTVCFGTGGGGNYCVPPTWIGRNSGIGVGQGGLSCQFNEDCRSGLCASGACADTCCSTAQQGSECATGTVCRFAAFPGNGFDTHETAWCGTAIGNTPAGNACAVDATCQSGKCANFTRCEAVCRSPADCAAGGQACSYGLGPTTLPANKDIVAGCVMPTGNAANGSACSANADCQSAFCDGSHCTDVCILDSDCKNGLHCRPKMVQVQGSYSVLCCES